MRRNARGGGGECGRIQDSRLIDTVSFSFRWKGGEGRNHGRCFGALIAGML